MLAWAPTQERALAVGFRGPVAFVFPGQGAQKVGMGRDLAERFPAAREVFDRADAAAGRAVRALCFEGSEEALTETANAQPAILVTSIACLSVVREASLVEPAAVAGHSLGEYSALVAAGALGLEEGVRLVEARARAMQAAAHTRDGAMSAVLGLDEEAVTALAEEAGVSVANWNCPGQVVLSGEATAIERAERLAAERGAKVVRLKVSGAFHSALMQPAAEQFEGALREAAIRDARAPVYCNMDATAHTAAEELREALLTQITRPVLWEQSVRRMVAEAGVADFVEFGGRVVSGLVKRIAPGVRVFSVHDGKSAEGLMEEAGA